MQPRSQGLFPYLSPAKGKGPGNEVVNSRCQFGEIGRAGSSMCCNLFSVFILKLIRKNFERTHLARAITDFVSFLVFNFRRALNDVICFVACTKN